MSARRAQGRCLDADFAVVIAGADLGRQRVAAQQRIHRCGHIGVHRQPVAVLDLDQHIEGGRRAALQHGLLRAAPAGFLIRERDRLDPAHQVGQGGVEQQVLQRVAVGRADQLHAALGDGAGGGGFQLAPDLVDDDRFGVVVFHRLDHHLVLQGGRGHLHAAGAAHRRVRHIAVAADLVGGIDDDHALVLRQDAGGFAQHGGLAHAGAPQDQQALAALDQVLDDIGRAVHGAPHPAGQADDVAAPVADGRDAVQGALQAGAVVGVEIADALDDDSRYRRARLPSRSAPPPGRQNGPWARGPGPG